MIVADRDLVESNAEMILDSAAVCNTAFLVVGDVFGLPLLSVRDE